MCLDAQKTRARFNGVKYMDAEDYELLGFFESEPVIEEEGIPWEYNTSTYIYRDNEFEVEFCISPAYGDFTIKLIRSENILFQFSALGVENISVTRVKGLETLRVKVDDLQWLKIILKPEIKIEQNLSRNI